APYVDDVTDRLEDVEGDADGQHDADEGALVRAQLRQQDVEAGDTEVCVLEVDEGGELNTDADSDDETGSWSRRHAPAADQSPCDDGQQRGRCEDKREVGPPPGVEAVRGAQDEEHPVAWWGQ